MGLEVSDSVLRRVSVDGAAIWRYLARRALYDIQAVGRVVGTPSHSPFTATGMREVCRGGTGNRCPIGLVGGLTGAGSRDESRHEIGYLLQIAQ